MISPKDLEELANLYDEGAQSLDPLDPRSLQALDEFEKKVEHLFVFFPGRKQRRIVIGQCKAFLKKNNPATGLQILHPQQLMGLPTASGPRPTLVCSYIVD